MIYDLITIALIVILTVVGTIKGAARTLFSLLFSFLSYAVSLLLGNAVGQLIYDSFIKNAIIDSVSSSVNDYATGTIDALPDFVKGMLSITGNSPESLLNSGVDSISDTAATTVEGALAPILISILSFLFVILLFSVLSFLMRHFALKPLTKKIEDVPVFRKLNRFLGGVFGFIESLLTITILACLLKLLLPYVGHETGFFSESEIFNSKIFYYFYDMNLFNFAINLFHPAQMSAE